MALSIGEVVGDMQTTLTSSLLGAAAGRMSQKVADAVCAAIGLSDAGSSVGAAGSELLVRGFISSALYAVAASTFPETANNVYFSFVYFTADGKLTRQAVAFADELEHLIMQAL